MSNFEREPIPEVSRRIYVTDESIRNMRKVINIAPLDAGIYEHSQEVTYSHQSEDVSPAFNMFDAQPAPIETQAATIAEPESGNVAEIKDARNQLDQIFGQEAA